MNVEISLGGKTIRPYNGDILNPCDEFSLLKLY